jgi:hypothetical protein
MAGRTPGRKPKLTREFKERLLLLLRAGVPREVACPGAGIASRTLRIWLERARNGEAEYLKLADEIEQAEAAAISDMVVQVRRSGKRDWKSLAWLLERLRRDTFHVESMPSVGSAQVPPRIVVELSGADPKP